MDELRRELAALAGDVAYPPTPDLARAVAAELRSRPAAPTPRRVAGWGRAWRTVAVAAAILLLGASAVLAASPTVRDAVLDLFGLRGARVERTPAPPPKPAPRPLHLGRRAGLARASRGLAFEPLVPAALGRPDGVHVHRRLPGGELALSYRPQPGLPRARTTGLGLLLTEFRGDLNPSYLTKIAPQVTRVRRLRIGGDRAIWIAGAPHYFFYSGPRREFRSAPLRIAQNVLLLERGRLLLRFEGAFPLRRARAIARSLRPGTAPP
jgi:hypothetical protein